MQKLVWQNSNGDEVDLTKAPYGITNWEGFSNTSLNIQSQQVPFQDGGVFLDALMEQRELSVTLAIEDKNNLENRYKYRRELIHILNPKLGEGYLIYTNDFTSKRIKCVPQIPLFETHNSNDSGTPKASLAWTACEPYWEDLEETRVSLVNGELSVVKNDGDIPSEVEISIYNQNANNITIQNQTSEKKIIINGTYTNIININTNFGKKNIKKSQIYLNTLFEHIGFSTDVDYFENINESIVVSNGILKYTKDFIHYEGKSNLGDLQDGFFAVSRIIYVDSKSLYVCVGSMQIHYDDYAYVATSQDGYNFTVHSTELGAGTILADIAYSESNDLFIAVGNNGIVITSSDLQSWTSRTSGTNEQLNCIDCSDSLIIVGGDNSTAIKSTDGITWVDISQEPNGYKFTRVFFADSFFILGTSDGAIYKTEDGSDFTIAGYAYDYIRDIKKYNGTYFISFGIAAVGSWGGVLYTNDFTSYTEIQRIRDTVFFGCVYDKLNGVYIAVGSYTMWFTLSGIIKENLYLQSYSGCNAEYVDELGFVIGTNYNGRVLFLKNGVGSYKDFNNFMRYANIAKSEKLLLLTGDNTNPYQPSESLTYDIKNKVWGLHPISFRPKRIIYFKKLNAFFGITNNSVYKTIDGEEWQELYSGFNNAFDVTADEENLYVMDLDPNANADNIIQKSANGEQWETIGHCERNSSRIVYVPFLKLFIVVATSGLQISNNKCSSFTYVLLDIASYGGICYSDSIVVLGDFVGRTYYTQNGYDYTMLSDRSSTGNGTQTIGYSNKEGFLLGSVNYYNIKQTVGENIIDKISQDSDMGLRLEVGENRILLNNASGITSAVLSFRKKYIGV